MKCLIIFSQFRWQNWQSLARNEMPTFVYPCLKSRTQKWLAISSGKCASVIINCFWCEKRKETASEGEKRETGTKRCWIYTNTVNSISYTLPYRGLQCVLRIKNVFIPVPLKLFLSITVLCNLSESHLEIVREE